MLGLQCEQNIIPRPQSSEQSGGANRASDAAWVPGFEFLPADGHWAIRFTSLYLHFLTCAMGIIIVWLSWYKHKYIEQPSTQQLSALNIKCRVVLTVYKFQLILVFTFSLCLPSRFRLILCLSLRPCLLSSLFPCPSKSPHPPV